MNLPTAEEINPVPEDLDGRNAQENFLGKTLEEAEAMFREASLVYQEDLMFMGAVAFRFYVRAAIGYIHSSSSAGDSDFINCFAGILGFRFKWEPEELRPIAAQLSAICAHVIEHYGEFDADPAIYGDLRPRYHALQKSFAQMTEATGD